jgi:hypothetical protein
MALEPGQPRDLWAGKVGESARARPEILGPELGVGERDEPTSDDRGGLPDSAFLIRPHATDAARVIGDLPEVHATAQAGTERLRGRSPRLVDVVDRRR